MTNTLFAALEERFSDKILSYQGISGGDINQAIRLDFKDKGAVFVKYNANVPSDMFQKEATALAMLKHHAQELFVPRVLDYGVLDGGLSFLVLEFVDEKPFTSASFEQLGRGLAKLHSVTFSHFGLDHDNYIGRLYQKNEYKSSFSEFLWEMRMYPQLKLAVDSSLMDSIWLEKAFQVSKKGEDLIPNEKPALLHGDLWSGNIICSKTSGVGIIDPAIYYGHREMELAFTRLFGGFSTHFYDAYQEENPLNAGFSERIKLYQLYPILVHVNLFGGSYVRQAESIIKSYS
ncbi:ketosamine-3-kinase [bacterium]|nr:MAG: ketosamine-3-kinase [bacterium]